MGWFFMMLHNGDTGNRKDLAIYRLERAKISLDAAKMMRDKNMYMDANNRAYYSILYSIKAVQALDGDSYKKHKDVIANFNKDYVKTGVFSREIGRRIANSEEIRHVSDYDDFYIASKDEVDEMIQLSEELLEIIRVYLEKNG